MYAWEEPFHNLVEKIRLSEMSKISFLCHLRGIFSSSTNYTRKLTLFFTLMIFVSFGGTLNAKIAFELAIICGTLLASVSLFLPKGLIAYGELKVSIKRIQV